MVRLKPRCVVTGVTIRRSPFHTTRQDVRFGHQIRGQSEWSLNNPKDPTLRRMIKVLSRITKGSDLLSFLNDRNWGSPGDKRKKPRWDLMRTDQQVPERVPVEQEGKVSPSNRAGVQDQLVNEETMGIISIAPPPSTSSTPDLEMDIEQVTEVMSDQGWGEEETILVDPARHIDIEEEEGNDSSSDSNDEECSTEEEMTHPHKNTVTQVPSPSLQKQTPRPRRRCRRKGRCKQGDGMGRVREAAENLPLRPYCSKRQVHRSITAVLHLGSPGRQDGLRYEDFDRCLTPLECKQVVNGVKNGGRCPGCIARDIGTGFSPGLTGKKLVRFNHSVRGDRTGMRAVIDNRVLHHQWMGLHKVQEFRSA
jgi:hypothetical protein